MVGIVLIVAIAIFFWLKNKQENRMIDRRNRILEKQDEIIEMLRKKTEEENKENNKDES
jgi:hypothetical protein